MWNALSGSVPTQIMSPQAMEFPPAREFLTSAGFAGILTLVAAIIVAAVLVVSTRNSREHQALALERQEHHYNEIRDGQQHAEARARCWQRLQWVVDTAGIEPASSQGVTLGLGPELATEILRGLIREADELNDEALGNAATVHLSQLSMVLAQQSGQLFQPARGQAAKTTAPQKATGSSPSADKPTADKPETATAAASADEASPATTARARRRTP
jgi:hypothetical protein